MTKIEDATDVAQPKGKGVMRVAGSPRGDSKIGASKVGGTMRNGSPEGGVTEDGSLGSSCLDCKSKS